MSDIEVEGLEQFLASLTNVESVVKQRMWEHIVKSAQKVRQDAKDGAPQNTGKLRRSLRIEYDEENLEATVYTKVFYAHFLEFGTKKAAAKPFLTPAIEQESGSFLSGMRDVFK